MSVLPPLPELLTSVRTSENNSLLANVLALLFESSPILLSVLVPDLTQSLRFTSDGDLPSTYAQLIDEALTIVHGWPWSNQAEFVGGHPRIGEVKALSALSSAEQGQAGGPAPTPPEVLERLAFLNAAYEKRYPGLVYITFVNGRSRAQIRDEMEEKLKREGILSAAETEGGLDNIIPHEVPGPTWRGEVERATDDVGRIAKSRLIKLGVQ